jgi:hypothetical protein
LLDLYPEFLRYGILSILEFIYNKKTRGICDKVYIYTNNQCSSEWCKLIANYFNYKLNTHGELFDKIICAFKINNKIVQFGRTTHNKTYNDFINCTLLPKKTRICFVDNSYFYEMKNDRVYYIQPLSYIHNLSTESIIKRFINSNIYTDNFDTSDDYLISDYLQKQFFKNNRNMQNILFIKDFETDIHVAQKIMYHVKEFFHITQ